MEKYLNLLKHVILGNPIADILTALGVVLIGALIRNFFSRQVAKMAYHIFRKKMKEVLPSELLAMTKGPFDFIFALCILYIVSEFIVIPQHWGWAPVSKFGFRLLVRKVYLTSFLAGFTWLGVRIIKVIGLLFIRKAKHTPSKIDDQLVPFFRDLSVLFFVTAMGFILLGKVFEVDVLTLVTSLGIGGLAIALAARETLENLFASFALMLDRPFTVSDTILINGTEGEVEKIGFRSTRLRTAEGSLVTIPNRLLTSQSLENLSERYFRRARFFIKLDYRTSAEQMAAVVAGIQDLLNEHPKVQRETATVRLDALAENTLDVLVIYFVEVPYSQDFTRVKEEVNLNIMRIVENLGVKFAFQERGMYFRIENDLKHSSEKQVN